MCTEVRLANGKGTHYGLGVEVRDLNDHREIEHSGEVSGFVSDNAVLIDDGAAVVVLTNQDAVGAASAIARRAAPIVAGYPPRLRSSRPSTSTTAFSMASIDPTLLAPNLSDYFTPKPSPISNPASPRSANPSPFTRPAPHSAAA